METVRERVYGSNVEARADAYGDVRLDVNGDFVAYLTPELLGRLVEVSGKAKAKAQETEMLEDLEGAVEPLVQDGKDYPWSVEVFRNTGNLGIYVDRDWRATINPEDARWVSDALQYKADLVQEFEERYETTIRDADLKAKEKLNDHIPF